MKCYPFPLSIRFSLQLPSSASDDTSKPPTQSHGRPAARGGRTGPEPQEPAAADAPRPHVYPWAPEPSPVSEISVPTWELHLQMTSFKVYFYSVL